jgi:hypothetical protein
MFIDKDPTQLIEFIFLRKGEGYFIIVIAKVGLHDNIVSFY